MKEPVKVTIPPALATMAHTGKRYAISGNEWIEVPLDTTRESLAQYMVYEAYEEPVVEGGESWEVKGSTGKTYTVTHRNEAWLCTCTGFTYRRKCKHIEEQKTKSS